MLDSSGSVRDPPPRKGRTSRLVWVGPVIAVVVMAAVTGLVIVPIHQTAATGEKWFGYTISSPGPLGTGYFVPPQSWCPPSNAVGDTLVTISWSTTSGAPVLVLDLAVTALTGFPPRVTELYSATNVSAGGFAFLTAYPTPCADVIGFGVNSTAPLSVMIEGALIYNYTTEVPLL